MDPIITESLKSLIAPIIVGVILWVIGEKASSRKIKGEAIRDLMTFRGDNSSPDFRRSLNKVSITFHDDDEIREDVRHLYELINNPTTLDKATDRAIVGLIYKLCQKNNFKGLTEYDIDQSFPENKQLPVDF